mmetsp:Transcript_90420/g.281190  ORF Transcript_90420/g.281190 Transcript_90420/m.281190 type:complete len:213 (-) Transcript_90420:241-879(-)
MQCGPSSRAEFAVPRSLRLRGPRSSPGSRAGASCTSKRYRCSHPQTVGPAWRLWARLTVTPGSDSALLSTFKGSRIALLFSRSQTGTSTCSPCPPSRGLRGGYLGCSTRAWISSSAASSSTLLCERYTSRTGKLAPLRKSHTWRAPAGPTQLARRFRLVTHSSDRCNACSSRPTASSLRPFFEKFTSARTCRRQRRPHSSRTLCNPWCSQRQ